MEKIIMHVDLDAFYASVEEQRRPEIRGKPVAVCVYSGRGEEGGAIATANYKARALGIKAGMPIAFAKRAAKDKGVVFLPVDKEYYTLVSDRVMELFEGFCDVLEQASIDEAYLDVSRKSGGEYAKAEIIAKEIKTELTNQEGLTCSIGIAPNKFMAKMAGKRQKPDGLTIVRPAEVRGFLKDLPASRLHGIGGKTEEAFMRLGIKTAGDLAGYDIKRLEEAFGVNKARLLRNKALGIDDSPVAERRKQQVSRLGSLSDDTDRYGEIIMKIKGLATDVERKIKKMGVSFKTISVSFIDSHLRTQTRSKSIEETNDLISSFSVAEGLTKKFLEENPGKMIRRVGIGVSNLSYGSGKERQKTLGDY